MSLAATSARPPVRHELFGTQVHALGLEDALAWIRRRVADRAPAYVVTINGAMLMRAAEDHAVRELVNGAGLVTADGVAVILAARILGVDLSDRVAGIDLAAALCARAAATGDRIFLFGGVPGVAEETAAALARRHTGLRIVGTQHGYYPPEEEAAVCARIRQARPDVLLVALGAPRQERWMRRWSSELRVPVSIGVGGSFDVLAGRIPRAPRWMRRAGLEWLFRALRQPRRWAVIRTIPPLFVLALRERLRRR